MQTPCWNFKFGQSEKVLRQRLESVTSGINDLKKVLQFHHKPLFEMIKDSTLAELEELKTQRQETGDSLFFNCDIKMGFALANAQWVNTKKTPKATIEAIAKKLKVVDDKFPQKKIWEQGLLRLEKGPYMPPFCVSYPKKS